MDVDEVLSELGSPGRYHVLVCCCLITTNVLVAVNHLAMAVFNVQPPHHCKVPDVMELNHSLPPADTPQGFSGCTMYSYDNYTLNSNVTTGCDHGWKYDVEEGEYNVVMQYDMVCDRLYLGSLATTIYFMGVTLGGITFGSLSDKIGRKRSLLIAMYMRLIVGIAVIFSPTYIVYVIIMFFLGVFAQGIQSTYYVLLLELLSTKYRRIAAACTGTCFALGVIWVGTVSYLMGDWRHIQLVLVAPSVITLVFIWLYPESIRWLEARGRHADSRKVIERIAKFNNVQPPKLATERHMEPISFVKDAQSGSQVKQVMKEYTVLDLFRYPSTRRISISLAYVWFVIVIGYYGISFSLSAFPGNNDINLILSGVIDLPVHVSALLILTRFKRQKALCTVLALGGSMCVIAGLVNATAGGSVAWLSTVLALLGKLGMSACFTIMQIYTCELYPTVVRNVGVGYGWFCARLGGVVFPQLLSMGRFTFTDFPIILIGVLVLLGAAATFTLPKGSGQLVDQIKEEEEESQDSEGGVYS